MRKQDRILWAAAVVLLDFVIILIPFFAIFIAYLILARPPWFKAWIEDLYAGD